MSGDDEVVDWVDEFLDQLRRSLELGALSRPDAPQWRRPRVDRRRMGRDVAMFALLVVACWAPVVAVAWWLTR